MLGLEGQVTDEGRVIFDGLVRKEYISKHVVDLTDGLDNLWVYSDVVAHRPIEFIVKGAGEDYLDLGNSYLHVGAKIVKPDGGDLAAGDDEKVGPVNLWLHALFSEVDITLNGTQVTTTTNTYPYRAYLETLLNYGEDAKKTQLAASMFYKDTANQFEKVAGGDNKGMRDRKRKTNRSRVVDMIGRVHADLFSQEKFLLNGVDLRMRLTRSKDAFSLMAVEDGGAYPQYRVQIVHASLFVRKCKLNPAVVLGHARALEKATAKYPIQRVVTRVISIPAGNLNVVQDNLFLDQLPKQLFIGLVDSTAFNGHYAGSPFEFKHYHLNFLALYQEGKQVPVKALKPNFVNGEYMRSYMSLFSGTNTSWKDVGNTISPSDYDKGYTLYGFDLTPSLVDGNQAELIRAGSLRLEMSFALGLQAPVHVILYAQFDGLIEIDKSRQVCVDVFEYEETTDSFIVKQRGGSEDFPDILNVLYFRGHFCYIKTKNKEEKMEEEEEKMETESDVDEKEEEEDDDEDNEEKTETADVDEHPFRFLIKRHNDFMCICTEKLKFLDIINYLAPGTCRQSTQFVAVLIPIGFFVYQYAKLRMLQFHYDLVDKFVSRADYQLCEMDTDSLYMALSTSSFEEAVKPELRQDFYTHYNECSTQGDKSRAKGLNQKLNQLTKDTYLQVLNTQTSGGGVNRGFRTDGQMMYTYTQERKSLSYLYIKRQVQADGVSTKPLLV
nr:hypothetical protein BaRGS_031924 [Batillaria attramentaria]